MVPYKFPEQKTTFADRPLTAEALPRILEEFSGRTNAFTGFLKAYGNGGTIYFLFFLKNEPYAAGKFNGKKPFIITVSEFVTEIFTLTAPRLSLHETDPVLIKSMLIFLQDEPTAKAPVSLIDLEQIVRQIFSEAGDALIVLEKERMFNFFFIKDGKTAHPHYADPACAPAQDLSFEEQILLYAFEAPTPPVVAHIYRNIQTSRSSDVEHIDSKKLLEMAKSPRSRPASPSPSPAATERKTINVEIVSGPQKGAQLTVALPCTIGRKDCDIIINDGLASRRHACLSVVAGQVVIEDMGSTNGTLVNDSATTRATLSPTDLVTVGETRLKVF